MRHFTIEEIIGAAKNSGMRLNELAAGTGVSRVTLWEWRKRSATVPISYYEKLCKAAGLPLTTEESRK
jgi:transcriptional regulator with XRE-family HTH domain